MESMLRRPLPWLVATFCIAAGAARAQPAGEEARPLSPYFVVERTGEGGEDATLDRLPLKDTQVDVQVLGVIADVTVRQLYENRGHTPLHARYVFPASTRAAVYAMSMTIGERRIVAQIQERAQARRTFEDAKREGRSASLLEQSRPNVFSMSVANVMPGETVAVELRYTELLVPTAGTYEFVYPTVVGPRYSSQQKGEAEDADRFVESPYLHQGQAPRSALHLSAQLSTGVPLQEYSCPSHKVAPQWDGPSRLHLRLDESEAFSGNRDFVLRYRLSGKEVTSGLLLYQGTDESFFLLMAQPPERVRPDALPPREYVFVLDVSGSMNGFPLDTAKALLTDLLRGLRPSDRFNVVLFASGSATLSERSLPATGENLARALRFVGPANGSGGTELLAALKTAFGLPRQEAVSRSVVLVTDGYIEAERDVFEYVRGHLDESNVFAFGIGSSVNRYLLEGVARAGLGEPFVVTKPEEARSTAARFREYIESPVLTGIHVSFAGFDAYDVEPARVPDLFARRPVVVFGKWRGEPRGAIELRGRTGAEEYQATFPLAEAQPREDHRALRYLWARSRVADLSDLRAGGEDDRTAVTQLGLAYNLLTRYTSFVAVEQVVRNPGGQGQDVDQPLPLPVGVSDLAVGGSVTGGAEPELAYLAAAVACLLLGARALGRRRAAGRPW